MATTEVQPTGVTALGKTKVAIIPAAASIAAITQAELGAGINISWYIPGSNYSYTVEQNTGQDVRLGAVQVFDVLGQERIVFEDLQYIHDPQTPGSGTPAATFVDGYTGFIVIRYGILASTDWAATQKYHAYPITLGARTVAKTSDDEFGKFVYSQKIVVTGTGTQAGVAAA